MHGRPCSGGGSTVRLPEMSAADGRPTFSSPVCFPFVGTHAHARAVRDRLAALPPSTISDLVIGDLSGSNAVRAGPGVQTSLPATTSLVVHAEAADPPRAPKKARRTEVDECKDDVESAPADADFEGGSLHAAVPPLRFAPPSRRKARAILAPTVEEAMADALTACVRRCCGLPSTVAVGRGTPAVAATVVGDPKSRSRAVALRYGHAKRDAVLWVSPRGGLICSCFGGTQNALLISASSRNSDCQHTVLLSRCLALAGVPPVKFRQRMQLRADAQDFASCKLYGTSLVWTVLYKRVFSLVTFSKANVASCVAPGCRRFRGRCGHVKISRPLNAEWKLTVDPTIELRSSLAPPSGAQPSRLEPKFLVSAEEDMGIERLPSDTQRAKTDPALERVARRVMRNMLPCPGELHDGDVWVRTADWMRMYADNATRVDDHRRADLKAMGRLISLSNGLGHTRDMRLALVESYCGSCGCKREERHQVVKEHAVIYTHHPSAPTIAVRSLSLSVTFVVCPGRSSDAHLSWCTPDSRSNSFDLLLIMLLTCPTPTHRLLLAAGSATRRSA